MIYTKEFKELLEQRDREYRDRHPLTSDERHNEILEASKSISLDDYNPNTQWRFQDGDSPWGWYDAQVAAMNHFGHIFCIDPYYGNFTKYNFDKTPLGPNDKKRYGFEYESTEKMIEALRGTKWMEMTIKTIEYLRANCGIEFPNGWGDQFLLIQEKS